MPIRSRQSGLFPAAINEVEIVEFAPDEVRRTRLHALGHAEPYVIDIATRDEDEGLIRAHRSDLHGQSVLQRVIREGYIKK
jgi:hypothetical protein